ncbi:MAG TPA: mercury resistance system periplasmic binding protein MerP [Burkholderiales bacterium]|nr:mercury resistance system periplasmic binding protein MerP [Burkholderiales bacterium]
MLRNVLLLAGFVFASAALAEDRTVTLSVPGMYCEMCPATVKKALSRVPGVVKVDASYKDKQAVVTYDDSKTSIDALTGATANAGYPSTPKQ